MNVFQRFKKLFDPVDLTQGRILKVMIPFFIPIMLSMIFQQLYSLTDSIIVGQNLSSNEIAGVSDAIPMIFLVLTFTNGLTAGFSTLLSDAVGAGDEKRMRQSFFIQIVLSAILTVILTIVAYFLIDFMLSVLKITPSETDSNMQAIYESARTYMAILFIYGIFSQMFYNLITAVLRGIGDSFLPFLFLVLSTILNVFLDLLFIIPLKLGVAGSAYATVISQFLSAFGAFLYAFLRYPKLRIHKEDMAFDGKYIAKHLWFGLPLGFQYSILYIGVVVMQAAIIPFDIMPNGMTIPNNPAQMGYGVSNKLSGVLMNFLNAVGMGMLTYISQNKGANKIDRIKKGFIAGYGLMMLLAAFLMTIGLLLTINGAYQHIFLASDKITDGSLLYGNTYLYIALPFYFFLGTIYMGRNTIQGLGKPLFPLLGGISELITRVVICAFLPSVINEGPINSEATITAYQMVCWADPITWFFSGAIVIIPSIIIIFKKLGKEEKPVAKLETK